MAQHDMNIANQGFPAFRSDLNNALSAIQTNHSGTSRPSGAVAGQIWLDTTSATNPTLKFFDGTDDISLATIDYSANTVNWLDSTVSVTGLATTATGTVLTLSDTATTQTVNFIIDNEKEIRFSEADGNGSNYVALKAPASLGSDVTFTLPSADGTADQVLKTDGSGNLSFADASGGGIQWQSTIVTVTTLSAVAGNGYWIDTTSNACTITLPASASVGDQIIFSDYKRTWGTNAITINQNSLNFQGYSSPNPVYNTNGQSVSIVYSGATQGWIPTVDDDVTNETPQTYSAEYLVVAGGGGGGGDNLAGGGGAGGLLNGSSTFTQFTSYTVTVGAGGASGQAGVDAVSGSDSTLQTTSSTITSFGGGLAASNSSPATAGGNGGSGGGGALNVNSGGSGTVGQGNGGGYGQNAPGGETGGGGGGAGAAGSNGVAQSQAGNGGVGLDYSTWATATSTGDSGYYAGGGGASINGNHGQGIGGTGGGGNGKTSTTTNEAGAANTGGGGGAGNSPYIGNGGSGIIIIRYSGSQKGTGGTVTSSGGYTYHTFTSTGTYTG
jgi:hypothetical protein